MVSLALQTRTLCRARLLTPEKAALLLPGFPRYRSPPGMCAERTIVPSPFLLAPMSPPAASVPDTLRERRDSSADIDQYVSGLSDPVITSVILRLAAAA
jgi:hypothetical protein